MREPDEILVDDENVTTAEAAVLAGVSAETIRQWAARGYLEPVRRVGGRPRYRALDVAKAEAATRRRTLAGKRRLDSAT